VYFFLTFQVYKSAKSKSWIVDHSTKLINEEIKEDNAHAWMRNLFTVVDGIIFNE